MNRSTRSLIAAVVLMAAPGILVAQRGAGRANRLPPGQGGQLPPEQQIGQILEQRLLLTDAQRNRMRETNTRFLGRKQSLGAEERQTRKAMRDMICSGDTTHGADMSHLLDQWHDIAKRRVQLQEDEQHELSTFLSPYQRAKYIGFEEQFARLMDDRLGGRGGRGMQPPPDGQQDVRGGGRGGRAGRQGMGPPPDGGQPGRGRGLPPDACGPPPDGPPPGRF